MRPIHWLASPALFAVVLCGACTTGVSRQRGTEPWRCAASPRGEPAASAPPRAPVSSPREIDGARPTETPRVLADRLYWTGAGGNLALRITGKFNSGRVRSKALALDQLIGRYHGRSWTLSDILVSVDFNAMGTTASWVVSGPGPLIGAYAVGWAKRYQKRIGVYDLGVTQIPVLTTAQVERIQSTEK